jgi:hypothetical protein
MNNNNSGELLSADYDGETSPEEHAIVERLLETSSEARRELDEIGALSELLHSIPRQSAPVELAPSVLHRAEHESLLPAVSDSAKSSFRMPNRLELATGLVTVAAVLLLVVFLVNKPNPEKSDSTQIVQHSSTEEAGEAAKKAASSSAATNASADESATAGKIVDAIDSPQPLSATQSKSDIRSFAKSALNASRLRDVQIGDVIPYFAVARNQVAVLEVTVVDVQKAVGTTQLLLEGNQIPRIVETITGGDAQNNLNTEKAVKSGVQSQKTTVGLFAVYIESSESQLAETMEQLRREGILTALKLLPPVELSQVKLADSDMVVATNNRSRQKQEQDVGTLADAVMRGRSQRVKLAGPSAEIASPSAQPPSADKRTSKKKSVKENKDAVPKGNDTLSKKTTRDLKSTTGNAFQMLVNVLPRSLTEKTSGRSGEKKPQVDETLKKAKRAVTTLKLQADSVAEPSLPDDTESAPIRVILVFQGQQPAEAVKPE